MEAPLRVLIVDDHQMFREGIRSRLEREGDMQVVGETGAAEEALLLAEQTAPAIVVLDIRLPSTSGIEIARLLRDRHPEIKVLVLSGYDYDQYVQAAARAGVEGYLLKDSPQDDLVWAIREIAGGGVVLPPSIASKLMKDYSRRSSEFRRRPPDELTVREIEVLEALAQGLRNQEIAQLLNISNRTAEAHVSSIITKLEAHSRADAVRVAREKNLLQ